MFTARTRPFTRVGTYRDIDFPPQSSVLGCIVVVMLTLIGELFLNTRSEADNRKPEALNSIDISMERSADLRSVMYRHLM